LAASSCSFFSAASTSACAAALHNTSNPRPGLSLGSNPPHNVRTSRLAGLHETFMQPERRNQTLCANLASSSAFSLASAAASTSRLARSASSAAARAAVQHARANLRIGAHKLKQQEHGCPEINMKSTCCCRRRCNVCFLLSGLGCSPEGQSDIERKMECTWWKVFFIVFSCLRPDILAVKLVATDN